MTFDHSVRVPYSRQKNTTQVAMQQILTIFARNCPKTPIAPIIVNGVQVLIEDINKHNNIVLEYDARESFKKELLAKAHTCMFYTSMDDQAPMTKQVDLTGYSWPSYYSGNNNKTGYTCIILKKGFGYLFGIFFGYDLVKCFDLGSSEHNLEFMNYGASMLLQQTPTLPDMQTMSLSEISEVNCKIVHYYVTLEPFAITKVSPATSNNIIHVKDDTAYCKKYYTNLSEQLESSTYYEIFFHDDVIVFAYNYSIVVYDPKTSKVVCKHKVEAKHVLLETVKSDSTTGSTDSLGKRCANASNPLINDIVANMIPKVIDLKPQVDEIVSKYGPVLKQRQPVTIGKDVAISADVLKLVQAEFDKYPSTFKTELVDGVLTVTPV